MTATSFHNGQEIYYDEATEKWRSVKDKTLVVEQSKPITDGWEPPVPPIRAKGKQIGSLTVKVNIDCSDALKGLKAVQREARKAKQALKELDEVKAGVDHE